MDSESASSFNYDSYKDDISKIHAVLKKEFSNEELEGGKSYDFNGGYSITEAPWEGADDGQEIGACSLNLQNENIHACLMLCFHLKELVATAIAKLDALDEEIDKNMDVLEDKLARGLKLQHEEKKRIKYYKPINLFATPYFRDVRKSIPSPNEDSIMKRISNDVDAYTGSPRPWTAPEYKCLRDAVIENSQQKEMEPLNVRVDYYNDKVRNGIVSDEEVTEIQQKLEILEEAIKMTRKKSVDELLAPDKELDWMRISTSLYDFNRTADECEYMWYNYLHPSINKKKWTKAEDQELEKTAKKHQYRDWESIANELAISKRTAIQCLERYQSSLNPNMLKSIWTPEDDAELKRVVEMYSIDNFIPWNKVTYHIDGRSRIQVFNRWTRSIAPDLKKDPWTHEEDAVLLAAVDKYGFQWTKIEDLLHGRSNFACRERYTNILLPGVLVGNWTKEEDRLLFKLMKKYPEGKWTKIASHLKGRTDNMCLQRASRIRKRYPHLFNNCSSDIDEDIEEELNVPTHCCRSLNSYRENVIVTATKRVIQTIMKVKGLKTEEEAKEALTPDKTSRSLLVALSQQLLGDANNKTVKHKHAKKTLLRMQPKKKAGKYKPRRKSKPKSVVLSRLGLRDTDSDDDDDISFDRNDDEEDEELYVPSENSYDHDNHVITEEELQVDEELDSLFKLVESCGIQPIRKGSQNNTYESLKSIVEQTVVKSLLHKAFQCEENDSESEQETIYRETDFATTIPFVCNHLVFPCNEDEIPVFPPNHQTLQAFKIMLLNRKMLVSVVGEKPCENVDVFLKMRTEENQPLFCTSCSTKDVSGSQSDVVNMLNHPTNYSENKNMMESEVNPANTTVSFKEEPITCIECQQLHSLRKDYHLLRRRFFSLFLWPALVTNIKPTEQQRKSIFEPVTSKKVTSKTQASSSTVKKKTGPLKRKKTSKTEKKSSKTNASAGSPEHPCKKSKVQPLPATRRSPRFQRLNCHL